MEECSNLHWINCRHSETAVINCHQEDQYSVSGRPRDEENFVGTDFIFCFNFQHFLRTRTGLRSVEKTYVKRLMEKGLSFVQLSGALAFVLFSERLLAMLQPAALALLAARAETRRGYCHPLAAILYPQEKIRDGSKRFFRTVVKKVSYNSWV